MARELIPKLLEAAYQRDVRDVARSGSWIDDYVAGRQPRKLLTKGFADDALNAIPVYRVSYRLGGHGQAEPRMRQLIGQGKDN